MATLADSLSTTSDSTAIIVPGENALTISFRQLAQHIQLFQRRLASLGIVPESAVSIALPNSYAFVVAFLAAAGSRAIAAPLNPGYKQDEFQFYIDDLRSAIVLVPQGATRRDEPAVRAARKFGAAVAECYWNGHEVVLDTLESGNLKGEANAIPEAARPEDIALVLHTSGTTGRPKAVPLTHRNLVTSIRNIRATYQLGANDRGILTLVAFHVHGLMAGLLAPLHAGGSVIVPPKFSASDFWHDFIKYRANWYTAVPTVHQILLRTPVPVELPKIRFIRSCSSPLAPKTIQDLEKTFKAPVLEAYAMTEAAHQMTSNPLPPGKRRPGTVGVGQGVEIKILDQSGNEVPRGSEAEICIRGENVTKGYLNNPSANQSSFTESGFFRTGDQGKMDAEGYLTITGRIKELINKGGEKISPIEIDNVVAHHPSISEAVSFAIDDEIYGQDIGLAVVLKADQRVPAEDIRRWMAERVVKFKVPKQIYFTDSMPKTPTGKTQRRLVAEAMLKAGGRPKL